MTQTDDLNWNLLNKKMYPSAFTYTPLRNFVQNYETFNCHENFGDHVARYVHRDGNGHFNRIRHKTATKFPDTLSIISTKFFHIFKTY